jgi:hypothetical protein
MNFPSSPVLRAALVTGCCFASLWGCGDDSAASGGSGGGATSSGATTVSSSSGAGTTVSASSASGGCQSLGDACSECAFAQCNTLYCACYANASCGVLIDCTAACAPMDDACVQTCLTGNQAGIADALLLGNCAAGACGPSCPTAVALGTCEVCALENCPAQTSTCLANTECAALLDCVLACSPGDTICAGGCLLQHPDGQDDATALQGCTDAACAAACG